MPIMLENRIGSEVKPLITIGIASYNYGTYLYRALEHIINNKTRDFEILICDDCSSDNSIELVEAFVEAHPDVELRLIQHENNLGIVRNKNSIIENCRGEYLLICDSDDYMGDGLLDAAREMILKKKPDRIMTPVLHRREETGEIIQEERFEDGQTIWGWNIFHGVFFKTSIIKENNISVLAHPDDVYFTVLYSSYSRNYELLEGVKYYWNVHWESAGRKKTQTKNQLIKCLKSELNVFKFVCDIREHVLKEVPSENESIGILYLKLYYYYMLYTPRGCRLKAKLWYYRQCHRMIEKYYSEYQLNRYLYDHSRILRKGTIQKIRLCALLERLHLMPLAIIGYHILTMVVELDQGKIVMK